MLGPDVPEWQALVDALFDLVSSVDARNAFVVDSGKRLWCRATPTSHDTYAHIVRQARNAEARGSLVQALPPTDGPSAGEGVAAKKEA